MTQRGFLLAGPMLLYTAIGTGVLILGLTVALKVQSARLETCQIEFDVFKLETKRLGEAAEKAAKAKETADLKAKERSDVQFKTTIARLNRDIKRVRDNHARSSLVPPAPTTSRSPGLACFERAEFAGALRGFEGGVEGLIGEGAAATVALDTAKTWAQGRQ